MSAKMKPKQVRLRAFEVVNPHINKETSEIVSLIYKALKSEKLKAKDRRLLLNDEDPNFEQDLISDFQFVKDDMHLRGSMLRIMAGSDVPNIPDSLFEGEKIAIDALELITTENQFIYKQHFYFYLTDKYLITTLPKGTNIIRVQVYLNWLIESLRGDILYILNPMVSDSPDLELKDIKSLTIQEPSQNSVQLGERTQTTSKSLALSAIELLKGLISSTPSLDDIDLEKIVNAKLVLTFKKPRDLSQEEYKRLLGISLKPISDTDYVQYDRKRGGKISASNLLKEEIVDIESTESGKLSEQHLYQEMEKYLSKLKS